MHHNGVGITGSRATKETLRARPDHVIGVQAFQEFRGVRDPILSPIPNRGIRHQTVHSARYGSNARSCVLPKTLTAELCTNGCIPLPHAILQCSCPTVLAIMYLTNGKPEGGRDGVRERRGEAGN